MEQLIRAATPYNYAMLAFLFFGVGSICFGIIIFIVSAMAAGKELLIMLNAECISTEKTEPFTYTVTYKYEVNELVCRKTCKQIFFAPKPGRMHRLIVDRRALLIAVPLAEMIKWIIIIMLLVVLTIIVDVAGIHERHIYKLAHQRWP